MAVWRWSMPALSNTGRMRSQPEKRPSNIRSATWTASACHRTCGAWAVERARRSAGVEAMVILQQAACAILVHTRLQGERRFGNACDRTPPISFPSRWNRRRDGTLLNLDWSGETIVKATLTLAACAAALSLAACGDNNAETPAATDAGVGTSATTADPMAGTGAMTMPTDPNAAPMAGSTGTMTTPGATTGTTGTTGTASTTPGAATGTTTGAAGTAGTTGSAGSGQADTAGSAGSRPGG